MDAPDHGERARELAREVGFDLVGIASADPPAELAFFAEWVARGYAGEMGYLTSQVAKRSDLRVRLSLGAIRDLRGAPVRHPAPLLHRGPARARAGSRATPGATTTTT